MALEPLKRPSLKSPEAYESLNSFGDLARVWKVSAKTVVRWLRKLGKKAKIKVHRPSAKIAYLTDEEAARFWQFVECFWDDGGIRRERTPVSSPRQKRR